MTKTHNRCGEPVSFNEVSEGYYAQCPNCDEDLYSFEVNESNAITCVYCKQELFDLHAISGAKDAHYATGDQDFGCEYNPINNYEGVGGHLPNLDVYYLNKENA